MDEDEGMRGGHYILEGGPDPGRRTRAGHRPGFQADRGPSLGKSFGGETVGNLLSRLFRLAGGRNGRRGSRGGRTGRLLAEEGFAWHGDFLNDDLPYFVHFLAGISWSCSSNMECNDLPLYMRHGNPPRVMLEIFQDWLDYARKYEQGAAPIDPDHPPHVFGRPVHVGVPAHDRRRQSADDVWIGTRSRR